MIVAICVYRGEVISKAGPEEAVIYADIGEWQVSADSVDQGVVTIGLRACKGVVILCVWWSVCVEPLRVLTWPVPRPAVLSRHPAADPDHSSASQRHLRSDVYAGRVELSAETLRERKCETQTVQQITAPLSRLLPEAQDLIRVETRDANMFGQPQHCALLQDQTVILFCVYPLLKLSSWSIENLFFTSFIKIENQHFLATAS